MDEILRFDAERAAGERRRDSGIELAAVAVVLFAFGLVVPIRREVTLLIAFILMAVSAAMITSGHRKLQRGREGLIRELRQQQRQ